MRDVLKIALGIAIGLLGGAALLCFATTLCLTTTTISRAPTPVGVVPHGGLTPAPEGRIGTAVTYDGIRLTLLSYEFSDQYWAKYSDRLERPPAGARFLWVRIRAENVGKNAEDIPGSSAFSLSYEGKEISPKAWAESRDRPPFKGGGNLPGCGQRRMDTLRGAGADRGGEGQDRVQAPHFRWFFRVVSGTLRK